ncbi:MAG: AtpZ/AtpI family protein [Candidatus Omnitrophota bacterium]|jgi:hypothetical protein|nr:MAG: AtpZ/AtpI family protein [Candidatus Omnitrophota bacterium]
MTSMMARKPDDAKLAWVRIAGQCSFIPIFLALYPIAFFYIGTWLDEKLGVSWIKVVFLFLGIFSGMRQTYMLIKKMIEAQEKDNGT